MLVESALTGLFDSGFQVLGGLAMQLMGPMWRPVAWADRIELDLAYVDSRSLRRDIAILVRTVSTVLTGDGTEGHDADDPMLGDD